MKSKRIERAFLKAPVNYKHNNFDLKVVMLSQR